MNCCGRQGELQRMCGLADELQEKCRLAEEASQSFDEEMGRLKGELRSAELRGQQGQDEKKDVCDQLEKCRAEIDQVNQKAADMALQLQRADEEKAKIRSELTQQTQRAEQEKSIGENRIAELNQQNKWLLTDMAAKNQLIDTLTKDKENHDVDMKAFKLRQNALTRSIQQLESDLVDSREEVARLKKRIVDLESEKTKVRGRVNEENEFHSKCSMTGTGVGMRVESTPHDRDETTECRQGVSRPTNQRKRRQNRLADQGAGASRKRQVQSE